MTIAREVPARMRRGGFLSSAMLLVVLLSPAQRLRAAPAEGLAPNSVECLAVDPTDSQVLYAGTTETSAPFRVSEGGVYKSTDGGATWVPKNHGLTGYVPGFTATVLSLAIDPSRPQTLYAGTFDAGVKKSTDGGESWSTADTGMELSEQILALAVDPADPRIVYAGSNATRIYKTTDGAGHWQIAAEGLPPNLGVLSIAIAPTDTQTLYASTYDAGVAKSTNGGASWSAINNGLEVVLSSLEEVSSLIAVVVDPSDADTAYVAADQAGVFKTTDGGAKWGPVNTGLPTGFYARLRALAIHPTDPTKLYAGTAHFTSLYETTDGAALWDAVEPRDSSSVYALAFAPSAPNTLYAVTSAGVDAISQAGAGGGGGGCAASAHADASAMPPLLLVLLALLRRHANAGVSTRAVGSPAGRNRRRA